jgi:predicted membrane protein
VREEKPPPNVEIARALSSGLTWALSTALFLYLGSLVDGWLETGPVFTLIGAFVGAAAGFYYLYSQLMHGSGKRKDKDGPQS